MGYTTNATPSILDVGTFPEFDDPDYTTITGDDDNANVFGIDGEAGNGTINLGSPFMFNGIPYTKLYVSRNGSIQFTKTIISVSTIPSTIPATAGIYPFLSDFTTTTTNNYIQYKANTGLDTEAIIIYKTGFYVSETTNVGTIIIKVTFKLENSNVADRGKVIIEYGDIDFSTSTKSVLVGISYGTSSAFSNDDILNGYFDYNNAPFMTKYNNTKSFKNLLLTISPNSQTPSPVYTNNLYTSTVTHADSLNLSTVLSTVPQDYIQIGTGVNDIDVTGTITEVTLSAPFVFNKISYTKLYLGANGSIQFTNTALPVALSTIPTVAGIYPFFRDLYVPDGSEYVAYNVTTSEAVIIYRNSMKSISTTDVTCRVTLTLGTGTDSGKVVMEYGNIIFSTGYSFYAGISFGYNNSTYAYTSQDIFNTNYNTGGTITSIIDGNNTPFFKSYTSSTLISNKTVTIYPGVQLNPRIYTNNLYTSTVTHADSLNLSTVLSTVPTDYIQIDTGVNDVDVTGTITEVTLSAPFVFNKISYTKLYLGANGSIQFTNTALPVALSTIPTVEGIYPFFRDLYVPDGSEYVAYNVTTSEAVIIYRNSMKSISTTDVTCRVTLTLGTGTDSGKVVMEYGNIIFSTGYSFYAGISFGSGNSTTSYTSQDIFNTNYNTGGTITSQFIPTYNTPFFKSYTSSTIISNKTVTIYPGVQLNPRIYTNNLYTSTVTNTDSFILSSFLSTVPTNFTQIDTDVNDVDVTGRITEVTLSAPFVFNKISYTKLYLGANGSIQFTNTEVPVALSTIPTVEGIYPFFRDLYVPDGSEYVAYNVTTSRAVIIYRNSMKSISTTDVTCRVTLTLGTGTDSGKVVIEYGNIIFSTSGYSFYAGISFGSGNSTTSYTSQDIFNTNYNTGGTITSQFIPTYNTPFFKSYTSSTIISNKKVTIYPGVQPTPTIYTNNLYTSTVTSIDSLNLSPEGYNLINGDNDTEGSMHVVNLTTHFVFNGKVYYNLYIGLNGSIQFTNTVIASYTAIPVVAGIYPFFRDLNTSGTTEYVAYKVTTSEAVIIYRNSMVSNLESDIFCRVTLKLGTGSDSGNIIMEYGDMVLSNSSNTFYAMINFGNDNVGTALSRDIFTTNFNTIQTISSIFKFANTTIYSYTDHSVRTISNKKIVFSPRIQDSPTLFQSIPYKTTIVPITNVTFPDRSSDNYIKKYGDTDSTTTPLMITLDSRNLFDFNSVKYKYIYISYNGPIMFSNSSFNSGVLSTIPTTAGIYPFYVDLVTTAGAGYIQYKSSFSSTDTDVIIEYYNAKLYTYSSSNINFRVTLKLQKSSDSGNILIEYGTMNLSTYTGSFYAGVSFGADNSTSVFTTENIFTNDCVGAVLSNQMFKTMNAPLFKSYSSTTNISDKLLKIYRGTSNPTATLSNYLFTVPDPATTNTYVINPSPPGSYTFFSGHPEIGTFNDNALTVTSVGEVAILIIRAADETYAQSYVNYIQDIPRVVITEPTLTNYLFTVPDPATTNTYVINPSPPGSYTYESLSPSIGTFNGNALTVTSVGVADIRITRAADALYYAKTITYQQDIPRVFKPTATLSNYLFTVPNPATTNTYVINPSPPGSYSYQSLNPEKGTFNGNELSVTSVGQVTIQITREADATYALTTFTYSQDIPRLFKPTATITNYLFTVPDPATTNTYVINPSPPGSYTYQSSPPGMGNFNGNQFTATSVGEVTIQIARGPDATYALTYLTYKQDIPRLFKPTATISNYLFTVPTVPTTNTYVINPSPSGTYTYACSTPDIGTFDGNAFTAKKVGYAQIQITREADATYALTTFSYSQFISKLVLTITNYLFTVPDVPTTNTYVIDPSPPGFYYFECLTPEKGTFNGNTFTAKNVGQATIRMTRAADGTNPEKIVTYTQDIPRLLLTEPPIDNYYITFPYPATTNTYMINPTPPGSYTYQSLNPEIGTFNGNELTVTDVGYADLQITREADAVYYAKTIPYRVYIYQLFVSLSDYLFTVPDPATTNTYVINPSPPGSYTYECLTPGIGAFNGNAFSVKSVGPATIRITRAANGKYAQRTLTYTQDIPRVFISEPTLTNYLFTVPSDAITNTYVITPSPPGSYTYESLSPSIGTFNGNEFTVTSVGVADIRITRAPDALYYAKTITYQQDIPRLLIPFPTIDKVGFIIQIPSISYTGTIPISNPSSNSSGTFTYTSSDQTVATITGNTIKIIKRGITTVTGIQSSDGIYRSDSFTFICDFTNLSVVPTLTNFSISNTTLSNPIIITKPLSNSLGNFTYTSNNTSIATINGDQINVVGLGETTITATQQSDGGLYTSESITSNINTNRYKINPNLRNFDVFAISMRFIISRPYSNNPGGQISYVSSDPLVASIEDANQGDAPGMYLKVNKNGTCTITAIQEQNGLYEQSSIDAPFNSERLFPYPNINITVSFPTKTNKGTISSNSQSTGNINYTSDDTSILTISGTELTIIGKGVVRIFANQAASDVFRAKSEYYDLDTRNYYYNSTLLNPYAFPHPTTREFDINTPETDSLGSFFYSVGQGSPDVATIAGNRITIKSRGIVQIYMLQSASGIFNETLFKYDLDTAPYFPLTNLGPFLLPTPTERTFTIIPPTTNRGGAFIYESSDPEVAEIINNSQIRVKKVGTTDSVTITATQVKDGLYESTPTAMPAYLFSSLYFLTPTIFNYNLPSPPPYTRTITIVKPGSTNLTGEFTYTSNDRTVADIIDGQIIMIKSGLVKIIITQEGSGLFNSKTVDVDLNTEPYFPVTELSPIVFPTPPTERTFTISQPNTNRSGTFTYESSDPNVAEIINNSQIRVKNIGSGSVIITAKQSKFAYYEEETIPSTLNTSNYFQETILSNFMVSIPNKPTDRTITLVQPISNRIGSAKFAPFAYTIVSDTGTTPSSISGNVLTVNSNGIIRVKATQEDSGIYTDGVIESNDLNTSPLFPRTLLNFNLTIPTNTTVRTIKLVQPISNRIGTAKFAPFTYKIVYDTGTIPSSISGNVLKVNSSGIIRVKATHATSGIYIFEDIESNNLNTSPLFPPVTANGTFIVTIPDPPDRNITLVPPSTNSPGAFTYKITSDTGPIKSTITGNKLKVNSSGMIVVTAKQEKSGLYNSTSFISNNLNTSPLFPAPNLGTFIVTIPKTGNITDRKITLVPPTTNSPGAFTYKITSDTGPIKSTITGDELTINSSGVIRIMATQASSGIYARMTKEYTIPLSDTSSLFPVTTLGTFIVTIPKTGNITDRNITLLPPSTNSPGAFTYKITSDTGLIKSTITGNELTINSRGIIRIMATQSSSGVYATATKEYTIPLSDTSSLFPVTTLGTFSIPKTSNMDITLLQPSTNREGEFIYTSSNPIVASIEGNILSVKSKGITVITSIQTNNGLYKEKLSNKVIFNTTSYYP